MHYNPHGYRTLCGNPSPATNVKEDVTCEHCAVRMKEIEKLWEKVE